MLRIGTPSTLTMRIPAAIQSQRGESQRRQRGKKVRERRTMHALVRADALESLLHFRLHTCARACTHTEHTMITHSNGESAQCSHTARESAESEGRETALQRLQPRLPLSLCLSFSFPLSPARPLSLSGGGSIDRSQCAPPRQGGCVVGRVGGGGAAHHRVPLSLVTVCLYLSLPHCSATQAVLRLPRLGEMTGRNDWEK